MVFQLSEIRPSRSDAAYDEIVKAIARIRFGSVLIQIQDGVVVLIESTEKKRFGSSPDRPISK
jgi:hypothetical protein